MKKQYSVLFIGNSYTYYNDMPTALFKNIAESAGYDIDVSSVTKGGYKLSSHANPLDEYGAKVEDALASGKKYDYVILQEQSIYPASENAEEFYDAVRNLSLRIRENGAEPILYSTWGRKEGNEKLKEYGWTNESMTKKLASSYQKIGDELDIPVVHVGLAFYDVNTNHNDIDLYDPDKSHPSYIGSYLAAATLFTKIFNENPSDVSFNGELSQNVTDILLEAAKNTVYSTKER